MEQESETPEDFNILLKHFLKATYLLSQEKGNFSIKDFSNALKRTQTEAKTLLSVLKGMNLVRTVPQKLNHYKITSGGKNNLKIVLTGGVFDIIHLGHINTLAEAKKLADVLIVIVASDEIVETNKGRPPLNNQTNRVRLLSHLDIVDIAVKGDPDPQKFLERVIEYQPDIIALGYDQVLTENDLFQKLSSKKLEHIEIMRLSAKIPNEKSSLKLKNIDEHSFD